MKLILKCSLLNGIEAVNSADCDGVEVQLLDKKNNFSVLDKINKQITSIHVDLPLVYTDEINGEAMLDFRYWLLNDFDYFKQICDVATKHNSAIVIHAFFNYKQFEATDDEFKNRIREIDKLYPKLRICIENTGYLPYSDRGDTYYSVNEIPEAVNYLNKYSTHNMFHPLLDICHYFQEFSSEVYNSPKPLAEIIKDYKSDFQLFHFNYGVGDCDGDRHSINFDSNQRLLKNILNAIHKINDDAYLVLEIVEKDYENRQDMLKLLNDIKEWRGEYK